MTTPKREVMPERKQVPVDAIVFDEMNREIDEDEEFQQLVDSIRVVGVLDELHLQERGDGSLLCIDGECRTRAARAIGLKQVPAAVWPSEVPRARIIELGLHKNVHRKAHGALDIARRLRQLKTEEALTQEEIATRTGLQLHRVKQYLSLFQASEQLFAFFEKSHVSIRVAVEVTRLEKECGELAARRLIATHEEEPLTVQRVLQARKRGPGRPGGEDERSARPARGARPFSDRVLEAFKRDPDGALAQLQAVASQLGYRLLPARKE